MIGSYATYRALPDGGYHGVYKPFYTKEHSRVKDKDGKPITFRDKWEAETIAWRECKRVERDHLNRLRADETQIKDAGRWYDKNTRMKFRAKDGFADRAHALFKPVSVCKEAAHVDAV